MAALVNPTLTRLVNGVAEQHVLRCKSMEGSCNPFGCLFKPLAAISGCWGQLSGRFGLIGAGQKTLSGVDRSQRLRNSRRIHVARFSGPGDHSRPISAMFVYFGPGPLSETSACGVNIGIRHRHSRLAFNIGIQDCHSTLAFKTAIQHRHSTSVISLGIQHWHSTLTSDMGIQHWPPTLALNIREHFFVDQTRPWQK